MFALPAGPLVRWRAGVIAVWTALALLFAPRATHVQQVLALRGGASETTESARASELLKQAFPSPFADYVAIVVHGPVRWTNQRFGVVLDTLKAATERRPYVSQVISVRSIGESTFVSRDRRTTFLIAALTPEFTSEINKSVIPDLRDKIRSALAQAPGADGFEVKLTGFPALDHDVRTISAEDTERGEAQALPLTLVVLVVAFGALVAAMLPVIVGVLAITIALGLVTVAAHYLPMSVFVLNITTMVGLGVGIDYSLLIVTRFREELNRGLSPVDAAVRTIETAGSAVITSGITVVVGFAALVWTPLSDTRSVGVGGLLVVLAAVLLATTLAGASARPVSRTDRLGTLGALARAPPLARGRVRRRRDHPPHPPARQDPPRSPRHQLVSARVGIRPGPGDAAGDGRERRNPADPRRGAAPGRRVGVGRTPVAGPQGADGLAAQRPPGARDTRCGEHPTGNVDT